MQHKLKGQSNTLNQASYETSERLVDVNMQVYKRLPKTTAAANKAD